MVELRLFSSIGGPLFYSMKITQDVREYGAQKEIDEQAALGVGMKEKAEEFGGRRDLSGLKELIRGKHLI